jgi:2-polyprenyl-6-methoxyphenol hydroxylase-like FAD-dependent oxidoreductase
MSLSSYGSHGDVGPTEGLALRLRALGAEVPVCAPPDFAELAVSISRGREVMGFAQDDTGVDVEVSDGRSLRAEYLVGCDGGCSPIRNAAGIEFPGWDPTTSHLIAEVELAEEPEWGLRRGALGIHSLSRMGVR